MAIICAMHSDTTSTPDEPSGRALLGEMHYSALVGGTTGSRGARFVREFLTHSARVTSIQAGLGPAPGRVLRALRFGVRDDGVARLIEIGAPADADWQPRFDAPAGASWTGISGASGWYIDSIRFHFDDGSTTPLYGGAGGDTTYHLTIHAPNGNARGSLRGLWGACDGAIETLGLIFWPLA
jgi:hypothetical protein